MLLRRNRIALFLLWFALPAAAQSPAERAFASRVSQERLQRTVRELVALGNRQGGTASGDRAAAYVARAFRSTGLPTETISEPQHPTSTIDRWTLEVEQPTRLRGLIHHAALVGFSPGSPSRRLRLVHVDPDGPVRRETVDSTVVLVQGSLTPRLYDRVVENGARAVLVARTDELPPQAQWALVFDLKSDERHAIPVYSIPPAVAERLMQELSRNIPIDIRFSARTTIRPGRPKTVVASIRGTGRKHYIVCAHGDSDSGGPGADDNASGVAGVIEIARVASALRNSSRLPLPAVGVRFIVWGSEYYSSGEYVKSHAKDLGDIAGVINFDEIGFGKLRNCLYFEGNDVKANEPVLRVLDSVGTAYAGRPGFWKEATTNPSQGGTDSYVFAPSYLRHLGVAAVEIPSVTVYSAAWNVARTLPQTRGWRSDAWHGHPDSVTIDFCPYYHSTMDLPSLTTDKEPFNMVWGVKAVGIALLRLAW